jgi:hypothetical protein
MSERQLILVGIEKTYHTRNELFSQAIAALEQADTTAYKALNAELGARAARRRPITEIRADYLAAAQS